MKEHADITFSLTRMEGAPGALKAFGTLRIAGVEREVTVPLKTTRKGANLAAGYVVAIDLDCGSLAHVDERGPRQEHAQVNRASVVDAV